MRTALYAALAVFGLSLAPALVTAANAHTYLSPPHQNEGSNN